MTDFKTLIKEYHPLLYKVCRSYTDNSVDFEDLYQEILIQVWKSLNRFKGDSKLSTWIYRVALNTALTYQRKQKKKAIPIQEIQYAIIQEDTILEKREKEQQIELLYTCIRALKKEERSIILLHLEGKQYDEIAEIIGITTSNVGVKLLRIKKKLFTHLNASGYGRS